MAHTQQTYDYQAFAAVSRLLSLVSPRKMHAALCAAAARVLHSRDRDCRNRWDYFAATAAGPSSFLPSCIAPSDRLSAFGLPVCQA